VSDACVCFGAVVAVSGVVLLETLFVADEFLPVEILEML
jgi:hypothetical protein